MASMDYDADSMSGLMPQILALTAPPGSRDTKTQQPQQLALQSTYNSTSNCITMLTGKIGESSTGLAAHPYFKRPGKGHNRDSCDSCSEGGDLICCDLCPASFHLTCHDPPLDEDEIPMGEWVCHQCHMAGNEDDRVSNSSNLSNKSIKNMRKGEKEEPFHKVRSGGREIMLSNSPLINVIKSAAIINPKQFMLPYELSLPNNFPGEPKEILKKNGSRKGLGKKKPYELDNGLTPRPARLCFQCNKSCRIGPMISCDYCPLIFHMDCLDPPLTIPPVGYWMCPNHGEHFVDSVLLTSHSLTERVKLWDHFSGLIDQDSVKLNFLRKNHQKNPLFRYKLKRVLRSRIRVPSSIKAQYLRPPDLLPHMSASQYLPFPNPVCTYSDSTNEVSIPSPKLENCSPISFNNYLDPTNELTTNITSEDSQEKLNTCFLEKTKTDESIIQKTCSTEEEKLDFIVNLVYFQSSLAKKMAISSETLHIKNDQVNESSSLQPSISKEKLNYLNGESFSQESVAHKPQDGKSGTKCEEMQIPIEHPTKQKVFKVSKKVSRLSTVLKPNHHKKRKLTEIVTERLSSLAFALRESLESDYDLSLKELDQNVIKVLAYQKLKTLFKSSESEVVKSMPSLPARALLCPLTPDVTLQHLSQKTYSMEPVPMTFKILNIGKGNHNHVDLSQSGPCNYVSPQHACILFDETTGHYELVNYSEYGTFVDGIAFNTGFSDRTISEASAPPFMQQVKAIIAQRRGVRQYDKIASPAPSMNSMPGKVFSRCNCPKKLQDLRKMNINGRSLEQSALNTGGWEGNAVLHHGSFIKFGCLHFVFSVVEEASKGDWARDTLVTYQQFIKKNDEERCTEIQEPEKQSIGTEEQKTLESITF